MTFATSVKLDEELKDHIQHLAESCRRSAHWIMREAIMQYVERKKTSSIPQKRAQHVQIAHKVRISEIAWRRFAGTGLRDVHNLLIYRIM